MNLLFLILIGIPLGVYLLVLVFSSRDFSPDGTSHAVEDASSDDVHESAVHEAKPGTVFETPAKGAATAIAVADPTAPVATEHDVTASNHVEVAALAASEAAVEKMQEPLSVAPDSNVIAPATAVALDQSDEPATTVAVMEAAAPVSAELTSDEKDVPPTQEIPAEAENTTAAATLAAAIESPSEPTPAAAELPPANEENESQPILSGQPLILPGDSPKYAFDYRGRLWVEKKRRGFFRQLRRPQLPPEDPSNNSNR